MLLIVMKHFWHCFGLIFSILTVIVAGGPLDCNDQQFWNGTDCVCLAYYTGTNCTTINCLNGGYLADPNPQICHCPVGYYGQYCETYQESPAQLTLFQVKTPNLIHFVNTEVAAISSWPDYLNATQQDPAAVNGVYGNYYLYGFTSKQSSSTTATGPMQKQAFFNAITNPNFIVNATNLEFEQRYLFQPLLSFIQSNKFTQTSINVYTINTAYEDGFDPLVTTAIAFQIRINIYLEYNSAWDSQYYVDLQLLKKLAFVTGGTYFSFTKHYTESSLYPFVMNLNPNGQLLAYKEAVKGNDSLTIKLDQPFDGQTYIVFVNGLSPAYSRGDCYVRSLGSSDPYTLQLFTVIPVTSNCTLTVIGSGARYIQAFGTGYDLKNSLFGAIIYSSFTDVKTVDTGYVGMKDHIPLYVRLHIENRDSTSTRSYTALQVSYENELGIQSNSNIFVKRDAATFEFVSDQPIACIGHDNTTDSISNHWLNIQFNTTIERGTFTENRYIPVKCFSNYYPAPTTTTASTTTPAPTTTVTTEPPTTVETTTEEPTTTVTTTAAETTTTQPTTTPIPGSECFPYPNYKSKLPSMVLGLSNYYPLIVRNNLLTGVFGINTTFAESNYNNFIGLMFDYNSFDYNTAKNSTSSYDAFKSAMHSYAYPNSYVTSLKTNILYVLVGILTDSNVGPNSAVTLLVSSLKFDDTPENQKMKIRILQLATTKQVKINLLMDLKYYPTYAVHDLASSVHFAYYEQLTAITDGHFLITTANSYNLQNGTYFLSNYFASLYKNAFNNKLALSKIFSTNKNAERNMGILDLRNLTGTRNFYFSAFFADIPFENGFGANITFTNLDEGQSPPLVRIEKGTDNFLSNFNSESVSVNLSAGYRYKIVIGFSFPGNIGNGTTVAVRLWQIRDSQDSASYDISYLNVQSAGAPSVLEGPRWDTMATAKITLNSFPAANVANITVDFFDCNGRYVPQFDNYNRPTIFNQTTGCSTEFYVNPFECQHAQSCIDDAHQNLYGFYTMNITLTDNDGAKRQQTAHFWCDKPDSAYPCPTDKPFTTTTVLTTTPTTISTTTLTTTSTTTTAFAPESLACPCLSISGPHQRGPLCTVPDCSRNGYLVFNNSVNNYVCNCLNDYFGTYCEQAQCTSRPYKTTLDTSYRTLTIAIIINSRNELASIFASLIQLSSAENYLANIYHFNIFVSCAGSTSQTIYFGSSKADFIQKITDLNNYASTSNLTANCGTDVEFNLTNLVQYGLKPLGKEVRGLFWLATHDSEAIYFDVPGNNTDELLSFYRLIQGYKQEIFISSVLTASSFTGYSYYNTIAAVRVTGGDRLDITSYQSSLIHKYIGDILKSQTSLNYYAAYNNEGFSTEAACYITISGLQNVTNATVGSSCNQTITETHTKVFQCNALLSAQITNLVSTIENSVYVSVRVLNGSTPAWTLVNETKQDDLEAFPVVGTYPSLAFKVPGNATVTDATVNGEARQADHKNCSHDFTSTFQIPLDKIGYNEFVLNVKNTTIVKKIIPFVVTDEIGDRCQNGGSVNGIDAKCTCPPQWSGPDCSRPLCNNTGSLNAMQTACYCDITHNDATCSSSFSLF